MPQTETYPYSQALIEGAFPYSRYMQSIQHVLEQDITDNPKAAGMRPYYQANLGYMQAMDTDTQLTPELKEALAKAPTTTWLVLTEGWCGDAARINPVFNKIAEASEGKVTLRFVLRDDNPELMNAHLTDGGKSIPKLIVLSEDLEELASWGPRPPALQKLMKEWKSNPDLKVPELIASVMGWYDADATLSTQRELLEVIKSYSN